MASFRERLEQYVLGEITDGELPMMAADGLEEGLDSPSLACLALADPRQYVTNRDLLGSAATELGIMMPSREAAVHSMLKRVASRIVSGAVSPIAGAEEIWRLSLAANGYGKLLDTFIYAASEWGEPRVSSEMHDQWSWAIMEAARVLEATDQAPNSALQPTPTRAT